MEFITFKQFLEEYEVRIFNRRHLRRGQVLMNYLFEVWPTEYHRILGTDEDCFYENGLIENTLDHLNSIWETHYYPN